MRAIPVVRSNTPPLRSSLGFGLASALLALIVWAASAPITSPTNEELFEIPKGTWARRMTGDHVDILPARVRLTLGVKNVLLLRNNDDVPQIFGPALLMPGQSFRLPFEVASSYTFACTAHASGQMSVEVAPQPDSPWARLRWRFETLLTLVSRRLS